MNQAILKLIDEKLNKQFDCCSGFDNGYIYGLEELKSELSSLPSDTQWIDVKNGNPKGFCNYIVTNGKSSFEAWYSDIDNIFKHIDDSGNCKGITHYMEFPNPPKR